jgi:hypothetical protein
LEALVVAHKKKPGPKPDITAIPLPFEKAVRAALETKLPDEKKTKRKPQQ